MDKEQYLQFVEALRTAERIPLRWFEQQIEEGVTAGAKDFFERCLPVEVMAGRGPDALSYGPMRPVGLTNPHTNRRPYAVVQLRQDNLAGTLYNLVGFQTNLTYREQNRVLRMIPGLEKAEFVRYGQMHRNTFIASPLALRPTMQTRWRDDLFFAGQITGVEGYMGNIATGLLAGINAALLKYEQPLLELPYETMLGALTHYVTAADMKDFQPMKANYGLLPELITRGRSKRERAAQYSARAMEALTAWAQANQIPLAQASNFLKTEEHQA
jgi:methylenetetrahydrofolate--tRNA-(uracil-5-)-methyltransferase